MRRVRHVCLLALFCGSALFMSAQMQICPPRPQPGSVVVNPGDLFSQNGVLNVDLTLQNAVGDDGYMHYCYVYMYQGQQIESPSLRLNPGDTLNLDLTNNIQAPYDKNPPTRRRGATGMMHMHGTGKPSDDPCHGTMILPSSTNVHFHGLNVPPVCHQDEVINTIIQSGDPAFSYSVQIPANDNPGLYWYHPHPHGFSTIQLNGGASGALIIEGNNPLTDGLTERVLVVRQLFQNPGLWLPQPYVLTLNYQQSNPPRQPLPRIQMQPGKREFWRILNASNQGFLTLQVKFGFDVQQLEVLALDGVPLQQPTYYTTITVPPAGRVELITPGLPSGMTGTFETAGYDTGPTGNPNNAQVIAKLEPSSKQVGGRTVTRHAATPGPQRFAALTLQQPTAKRQLYFSELTPGTNGPIQFLITVLGQRPKVFEMDDPPAIVTKVGAVEDWTIENHSGETHAFHIHQLHFLVMAINGVPVQNPALQDTFQVPNWDGKGPYPSVTLRMDFRDPNIAGTFVYHCHILDHEDGGMMAKIQVLPAN
ncbi:MAG: multicopper oxidase family protein [Candidatus Korobacteraceae bacterium]